ncbi:MAG: energy transducer TonB [Chitinophagaceae bacterium]|nr:energy transducer TonB [Chitinophagaceae bacterium]
MTTQQILKADLLDILFENRNKEYGAYTLRREYPAHLKKALALMLMLVAALFLYSMMKPNKNGDGSLIVMKDTLDITLDHIKEPEKPKEPERKVEAQPPTKRDLPPIIVDNPNPDKEVPDRTDTSAFVPGLTNTPGTDDGNNMVQGKVDDKPVIAETHTEPPAEPAVLDISEIAPEFPGGANAWMSYLQRMLRVPDELESGERKTVKVKFVVNKDGEVTDVVIVQSAGAVFDKEVLRVIAKMPKWKPGKQNGKAVAVYFTQPVTFAAEEEQ